MDDPTNYDAWRFWLDAIQWLFIVVLAVWGWIDRGRKDNKSAIRELTQNTEALEQRLITADKELTKHIDGVERRLTTAEEHLRHSPTHDDIARLREQYSGLESKLDRVTSTLDRIHDYLMNNKG